MKGDQLIEEVFVVGRDEAGLQAEIETDVGVELHDGLLKRGAQGGLDGLGELCLALEFVDFRFELAKGKAAVAAAVLGLETEDREEIGVVDLEVLVGVAA